MTGRPKLTGGKRIKKIDARFTEDEYKQISDLERALGVSKTELVRMRVLNNTTQLVANSKELIKCLDTVGTDMGRIGNNINQLAKHANTLQLRGDLSPAVIGRFNELFELYIQVQLALEVTLRKIIRAMGN